MKASKKEKRRLAMTFDVGYLDKKHFQKIVLIDKVIQGYPY